MQALALDDALEGFVHAPSACGGQAEVVGPCALRE